ncbi:MAG: DNA starvation/stationary phase protection protein, partial [Microbacterium sp. SCN 70-10]
MSPTTKDAPTKNRRRPARGGSGPETTDEQNAEKGFQASEKLTDSLQAVLVDLIELSIQGKQAHWNVVGKNFRDTHLQLDEIIDAAREFSDTVAERMRSLHALPDGRSDTIAETTTLPEFPQGEVDTAEVVDLITERLDATVGTVR